MTLTHYGVQEWGKALILMLACLAAAWFTYYKWHQTALAVIVAALSVLLFVTISFFFRNPHRTIPADTKLVVSPADGTIRDIEVIANPEILPFKGPALRVGIFLSVLNVHVNRAPVEMTVENVNYRKGEYLDARHAEATKRNEAMTISGTGTMNGKNFPVAVRQISGAIARRIVCKAQPGDKLTRGQLYGMIKFGSRTEIYLPAEGFELQVKIGDKVQGGSSVIAAQK